MRRVLAGLILLLTFPLCSFGQARGEVESIGFGSLYRPNSYVPMLIRVQADKSGTYQIRVRQRDLDSDEEIFKQDISLTSTGEGKAGEQRFWMYFIPQPIDGGLMDTTRGGSLKDLQQQLQVFLCDETGKQLVTLPITQTITNLEAVSAGPYSVPRGVKMILAVSDGAQQPVWRDYQQSIGTMEDVVFLSVRSMDLPEDVRGYEMVDGIVWLAAALPDPTKPSDEKRFHAIQSYVRGGGHLVICQPAQRDATAPIAEMLPVDVKAIEPRPTLEPLKTLATAKLQQLREAMRREEQRLDPTLTNTRIPRDDWTLPQGPFMFARAELKPGALAEVEMSWNDDGSDRSPYIARIPYGLGCVTWVAHDLSDPAIVGRAKSGWPWVWDKVLDFNHDLTVVDNQTSEETKRLYQGSSSMDIGQALLKGLELTSKSKALVSIAVVFFLAYWAVAGPGVYLYLLTKSRSQLSWFFFALAAVVATGLTVLVVKLVVRGPPELSHVTVVRGSGNEPMQSISRFGLYIPRDGDQQITLPEVSPKQVSYLTSFAPHPAHVSGDVEFPAQLPYVIPIHDASDESPVELTVPFRSTLKKFQTRRIGPAGGTVAGSAKIAIVDDVQRLQGLLTNGTGERLHNVYFVYSSPADNDDMIIYLRAWEKSQTVDLADLSDRSSKGTTTFLAARRDDRNSRSARPEDAQATRIMDVMGKAGVGRGWAEYWFGILRAQGGAIGNTVRDDLLDPVPVSLPMMSIFDRLPPMKNSIGQNPDRAEVLRRGGRNLDMSHAVAAGRMLIIAQGEPDAPLPYPLEVDGERVTGKGTTLYHFVIPMDRPAGATTKAAPAEQPPPQPFDPTTYSGPIEELTEAQRQQVEVARRNAARQQQLRGRMRPVPRPPPPRPATRAQ